MNGFNRYGHKLPEPPFWAIVNGIETTVYEAVLWCGDYWYKTNGCGRVQASAITPIPNKNWGGRKTPLEADKPQFPAAPDSKVWYQPPPKFDANALASGVAQTAVKSAAQHRSQRCKDTRAWLLRQLRENGGVVAAVWILGKAKLDGIAERSLRRAKRRLKIWAIRRGFGPKAKWFWGLPAAKMAH